MIRTLSKAALVAIVGIAGFSANQALAASATGNASLTVAAPLTIAETTALSFGSVTVGATGGTIVVTAAGATSYTGDVASFGGTSGTAALYTLGGILHRFCHDVGCRPDRPRHGDAAADFHQ